ncbi:contactin-2-like [Sorex araneus]|uniref:contactin-2-like n=1 Tax=Sorex araneus TaxID=42254 RepID=UPI00243390F1|nr:contactin-2-like [Sorex araneus]
MGSPWPLSSGPDFRLNPVRRLIPAARGKGTEILVNSSRLTVTPKGMLIIRNIGRSNEGKYTCFAENFMGKANGTGVQSVQDATKITLAPSSADINLGINLTLQATPLMTHHGAHLLLGPGRLHH